MTSEEIVEKRVSIAITALKNVRQLSTDPLMRKIADDAIGEIINVRLAPAPSEAPQKCACKLVGRVCGAPICKDIQSYSGWSHVHKADWMHWAAPTPYDHIAGPMAPVFVRCAICNQFGPDNEEHTRIGGHRFVCKSGSPSEAPQKEEISQAAEFIRLNTWPEMRGGGATSTAELLVRFRKLGAPSEAKPTTELKSEQAEEEFYKWWQPKTLIGGRFHGYSENWGAKDAWVAARSEPPAETSREGK